MTIKKLFALRHTLVLLVSIAAAVPWQCAWSVASLVNVADTNDFVFGVMNGVKLKIPRYYLFGPVVRVGESRIDLGRSSKKNQENPEIDVFGILLRTSNLQPVLTEQDRRDWFAERHKTSFMESWMMISFDKQYHLNFDKNGPDMISEWGPYILEKDNRFGLAHFVSVQTVDDGAKGMYGHVEYFYDKPTDTTILCNTFRKKISPFDTFTSCHQLFLVPKLHVMAGAYYTKKEVYRWREIEKRVVELIDDFSRE